MNPFNFSWCPKLSEEPLTDFTKLFKSTSNKFLPTANASCFQGVIVFLGIKVPAAGLNEYFRHHLQDKLHFIALGKEDKDSWRVSSSVRNVILGVDPQYSSP